MYSELITCDPCVVSPNVLLELYWLYINALGGEYDLVPLLPFPGENHVRVLVLLTWSMAQSSPPRWREHHDNSLWLFSNCPAGRITTSAQHFKVLLIPPGQAGPDSHRFYIFMWSLLAIFILGGREYSMPLEYLFGSSQWKRKIWIRTSQGSVVIL
jgi:hypothetical protein